MPLQKAMALVNTDENATKKGHSLHKSASSFGFNKGSSNLSLREARSFTGALDELKNCSKSQNYCSQHEHNINCPDRVCDEHDNICTENGYITKEATSNEVYFVRDEMLTYRGKRYSLNEIATRWKKDCRMWLWKNKTSRKNKYVGELREKVQNLRILNRPSLI